ncbi:MAG: YfcC family protein [Bacteroidota bacterium]|nr:YfcC family protein [Candidatus Kapabacteria bacterium]MDW8220412.1 YfcC family protein [Bacteroidota bacterium]
MKARKFKLPNTFILIFSLLVFITALTWVVPGGEYATTQVNGRTVIVPGSFHYIERNPQGFGALMTAPIKGFVEASLIIGFVLIVGGAFSVLQKTEAIDALIKSIAQAHERSAFVRAALIPLFMLLFSIGGATFGMNEEAIPFVLIFVPLALALGYDSLVGVAIPFVGVQVGFAGAFLNPFNVAIAQGIAGLPPYSGIEYRLLVWSISNIPAIAFVMWYAQRIKARPELSPVYGADTERRKNLEAHNFSAFTGMTRTHKLVLWIFVATLGTMIFGVIRYKWYIEEIAALFLVMGIIVGIVGRLSADEFVAAFLHGAKDLVSTALIIALARATMVVAKDAHIIDTMLYTLAPFVESSSPIFAAQKMFVIQSVINFFIHSGTGQAALTMPIMAPLADLTGITRQTAILAFQFGEFTNIIIPTSAITIGVLSLANIPWETWAKWILPLQLVLLILALVLLVPPCLFQWQ